MKAPDAPGMLAAGLTPRTVRACYRKALIDRGADPVGNTPEQHAAYINTEIEKWQRVAKQAGISPG